MKRGFLILGIFILLTFVYAGSFSDSSVGDFNQGTYNNTFYNGSAVVLSGTNLTGNFTSRIFDAGASARWDNLSWTGNQSNFTEIFAVDAQGKVYSSSDSGATWTLRNSSYGRTSDTQTMFSDSNGNLYIITNSNREIWRSSDSGVTWTIINNSFASNDLFAATADLNNNLYVIAGQSLGIVFKSNDSGVTWTQVNNSYNGGNGVAKGMTVNKSNSIFAVDAQGKVYSSSDSGATWILRNSGYGRTSDTQDMFSDSNGNLYIITNDNREIWKSSNSGISWTRVNNSFASNDLFAATADLNNNLYVIAGQSLGVVFKSINSGISWTQVNDSYNGGNGAAKGMTGLLKTADVNFQVKNCSLSDCSDGNWQSVNLSNINLNGRYFQYTTFFSRTDSSITSQLNSVIINYTILDNIFPNLTIISPLNQTYSTNNILINLSAADENLQSTWFYNGSANITYSSAVNYNFSQGGNTLIAYANDSVGNLNSSSVSFFVDSIAPTINIVEPQQSKNYAINTSLPLNFSISDSGIGVDSCWYSIDSGLINRTITNCQNTTFNVSGDRSYTLKLSTNDSFGNRASENVSFSVITTAPAVNILYPQNNSFLNYGENIYFNYTVDSGIAISACQLFGDFDGTWKLNQTNLSTANAINNFFVLTNLSDGIYNFGISCNDTQNMARNVNYTFTIDTIIPVIGLTQPTGVKSSRTGIPLTFSVNESNKNSCWYNIYRGTNLETANTTIDCDLNSANFDVTVDADLILNFYANDSAGNKNNASSSFSVSTSSGGNTGGTGGGGGGSRTIIQESNGTTELSVQDINGVVGNAGDSKKIIWEIKNTGTKFLNNCRFKSFGDYSSWISNTETRNLAAGEESSFVFDVKIPEDVSGENYLLGVSLDCDEISKSANFNLEVLEKKLNFELKEVKRISNEQVRVFYSLEEIFGVDQNVKIQFLLFDSNNEKAAEMQEEKKISANSKGDFETLININKSLDGELKLLVNMNSEDYSSFFQENIILGAATGLAIFGNQENSDNIISIFIIILFLIFAFFIVRNIIRHRRVLKEKKIGNFLSHSKHEILKGKKNIKIKKR